MPRSQSKNRSRSRSRSRSPRDSSYRRRRDRDREDRYERDGSSSSSRRERDGERDRRPKEKKSKHRSRSRSRSRSPSYRSGDVKRRDDRRERDRYEERPSSSSFPSGPRPPVSSDAKDTQDEKPVEKEKPNFSTSGALAAEQNTFKGIVLKYSEPPEARTTTKKWRLYVFKGNEQVDLLHVHRQSAYLFGRERTVVDVPIDHPSCSKQHAALQYRQITTRTPEGDTVRLVKPYLIDLEATNGTFVNGAQIPAARYVELKNQDVIKFGQSTREYVFMCEDES